MTDQIYKLHSEVLAMAYELRELPELEGYSKSVLTSLGQICRRNELRSMFKLYKQKLKLLKLSIDIEKFDEQSITYKGN